MRNHNIAVIPGDGIGPEVIVLSAAAEAFEFTPDSTDYDPGAQHYLKTGGSLD